MKDFLKSFFATLLALMVAGGLAFVLFFGLLAVIGSSGKPTVPGKAVLVFDLDTSLSDGERDTEPSEAITEAMGGGGAHSQVLPVIIEALDRAASDSRITALFLTGNLQSAGPAQLRELREAIQRFKAKKPVLAYNLGWGKRDYYLAAGATTVIINPFGEMEVNGLASEPMFFGEAFKKYGVEVQVTRVGKYKSAVEPFITDRMSDPNREQIQMLLDDIWGEWKDTVAKDRKKQPADLQAIADERGLLEAEDAKKLGLVDRIAPYDEVLDELKKLAGKQAKDKDFPQITLATYAGIPGEAKTGKARIAVLVAEGEIVDGEGKSTQIGGERLSRELRRLRLDERVKAVVLRVNSPGGSASASELIQREVVLTKKVKPLVISMGHLAASGGYWISTYGDRIFAEPTTITGSIGVFGLLPNVKKLANGHGITWDSVQTAKLANPMTLTRPKSDLELNRIQGLVDHIYEQFVAKVADSRKMKKEAVHEIAQGRVWSGREAVKLGLVDEIGGLGAALKHAAKMAKVENDFYVAGPEREPDALKDLLRSLGQGKSRKLTKPGPVDALAEAFKLQLERVSALNDPRGVYARMAFEIDLK
ncbi:MAG: signal peptide peptidase SppA [Geothrix sp.]|uniref:signal peptide peptidase SppA n=1 Tax=Geothrix sp. TaxID=1962974 RepID=UPI0017B64146|nr:signal peptide peptidase SppA [Geothrix sp.]NWJ40187.1 signal peptide peptidase SppA [Geothrix sp.]WIL21805.1 MAG: signal peptide peptidase SppA [Geothrix sp.]